ncbi:MAG: outer membrane protein assembly factor BamC [Succinatimonas sp.]|nr:outer membrane protein assembly factor BamC [Succinatimonas sp.]MDD5868511.1 outer membrane protein assembly factor BamC [Succinatimonas sp.]MDY5722385.1 outer membrane protein assembly factor BamC [Succinivibrio sp.]
MSRFNLSKIALVVAVSAIPAVSLSGCVTVKNYWQGVFGMDKSTREPTGYYEHADSEIARNTIVVPQGLNNPGLNEELAIPAVSQKQLEGPVGVAVDVRAPTAPFRSDVGCHSQWSQGEAIVWFEADGSHGIHTEDDAWMLLASVLKGMNVGVGKIAQGEYVLTTIARDFNEYGTTYSNDDDDMGLKRYQQIYQIRVGRNGAGEIGIACRLLASSTSLSNGKTMGDTLTLIEQERFAMGFSNQILHEIYLKNQQSMYDPDNLVVTLGLDDNDHDAILVEAPFQTTMFLLNDLYPKIGWKVTGHSVEKAQYDIEVVDSSDDFFTSDTHPLNIPHGKYKLRLGVHGSAVAITFYDEKDSPVKSNIVANLYQGFADALVEEYKNFDATQSHQVKITHEDMFQSSEAKARK